jgi:prepilin-type N-terminal cleavage/methylation domain-containing protein
MTRDRSAGFTLIEMMAVSAVVAALSMLVLPKVADALLRSKEASVKGHLGALRGAVRIYYSDNGGLHPGGQETVVGGALEESLTRGGRYLDAMPFIRLPTVTDRNHFGRRASVDQAAARGRGPAGVCEACMTNVHGAWAYSPYTGHVIVNCDHTDSRGVAWSLW